MLTYLVAFLISTMASFALTPAVRHWANSRGVVDAGEEERKVHNRPIPRVGGVAIAVAFFLPVFGLFFLDNGVSAAYLRDSSRFLGLVVGAVAMVMLGVVDDLRGLGAKYKLAAQVLVALMAFFAGYQIEVVMTPFGRLELGLLALPVTLLWIVGIVNAINLIDGLDGLASGIALFTVVVLFTLGLVQANVVVALTAIALAGAILGFLRYNFNPASIFMGDSGSLFLGYVLAVTAIAGSAKSQTAVSLLIPLIALGLPVFDTSLAIVRRFLSGRRIFDADRGHVHHRLLDRGLSHRQAVLVLYGGSIVLALSALGLVWANASQAAIILTLVGIGTVIAVRTLGLMSFTEIRTSLKYGIGRQARLRDNLSVVRETVERIRVAGSVEDVLSEVVGVCRDVRVDQLECRLAVVTLGRMSRYNARFPEDEVDSADLRRFVMRFRIDGRLDGIEITGELVLSWDAPDELVQVPESGAYDWLAMVVRDQVLNIEAKALALPLGPRLAAESLPPGS